MCWRLWTLLGYRYHPLECSCDLCGNNFEFTEDLVAHIKHHKMKEIDKVLSQGYGIVRCNRCWTSFISTEAFTEHHCAQNTSQALTKITISDP